MTVDGFPSKSTRTLIDWLCPVVVLRSVATFMMSVKVSATSVFGGAAVRSAGSSSCFALICGLPGTASFTLLATNTVMFTSAVFSSPPVERIVVLGDLGIVIR